MTATSSSEKDIPASLVFEAINSRVVVETMEGSLYKGKLVAYDTEKGNVELSDARHQAKDSSYSFCERVTIRGSNIRVIQLPPEMKAAPSLQWRRDAVQQELKKSLKRIPVLRSRPQQVAPVRVKKAPSKANKGKQLRRKLR
ncbi:putative small nuclear ribonucleaoprotein [Leptomonas pyrrhocoris]|uniref:Putative small nuclear ribonucleaoprotein n=1 Tax=Leptomonas pyrrhocoris TaxID=157538 RepID=A0A0M9G0S5_LEPPY|nr:putative small nuclear ribonucleaoprotein [Leptomonas pyrrhocoris]XP_015658332.1 putative small nuclear ribonucleaoprotein [Leptomonas pyrrhocoris]KPA79892.1 putative small nuclear ribonucleaoprotein [Leptomonas pyrrhocoris]KPA79893.1 putative small nuclear ribonucleaoprotein [Leptomonas pyrrhocoris]|eukprot:XP_015658331.1 putative small nuclear ribonucleaoprotein [Leptomonas pyrrhocoris]